MKSFYLGAAYYPEMWEESELEKDIARCKELGLNCLRIGEFAWAKMEPREKEYHFEWLENIVDKLFENGIFTLMCTPTCTPPRWFLDAHPEVRRIMPDLVRSDVSSRNHICKSSQLMRQKNREIVTELAKRFAGRKGVIGWQIDNELFPYGEGCFCETCAQNFRKYLKEKFGTIENLNRAWGMTRWSLTYDGFEDIRPPYPGQWRHPSLRKHWWDFQCSLVKSYAEEQAAILHEYGCVNVSTDLTQVNELGYYLMDEKLDITQYNHYERAEELPDTVFEHDFARCVKDKPFWVTETQANWNGSEFADNGYRPRGCCYVNTWLPFMRGGEMNLFWLFRTHPNGHEIAHGALYTAAGRVSRVSEEVKRTGEEIARAEELLKEPFVSKIAMHYSASAVVSFARTPLLKGMRYRDRLVHEFYAAFRGYNVDVIDTPHSLQGYQVLFSPFLATADENGFKARVTEWVKGGGTWIVGPMSDILDENLSKYTHAPYSFLEDLAGVYTKYQTPVANDVFRAQWEDGEELGVSECYDAYECKEGTTALARYCGGELDGLAAVCKRKVGKGSVILLGSVIPHAALRRLAYLPAIAAASENLILSERASGFFVAETQNKEGILTLDGAYTDLLAGRTLTGTIPVRPYEVLALKRT